MKTKAFIFFSLLIAIYSRHKTLNWILPTLSRRVRADSLLLSMDVSVEIEKYGV